MMLEGVREVPLARIRWQGTRLKELLADPFVAELAEAIEAEGLIHFPVVHKNGLRPIAGEHRLAAHVLKGKRSVHVRLFDGTKIEEERLRVSENLHRKHRDQAKLRVAYLEAREAEEPISGHDVQELPEEPKPGRKKDPKVQVRKQVAEELGVSERQLRRDEVKVKEPEPTPEVPHDLGIETHGKAHDRKRLEAIAAVGHAIEAAALKVDQARAALTRLTNSALPIDKDLVDTASAVLKNEAEKLRWWKPAAICPTCEDLDSKRSKCHSCIGHGWVPESGVVKPRKGRR